MKEEQKNSRRYFIKQASLASLAGIGLSLVNNPFVLAEGLFDNQASSFTLPPLPYDPSALEPHIDRMTMEIHHDKHHMAYVNNLNKALEGKESTASLDDIVKNISSYPVAVRNNGGGHWNHSFFWKMMKPASGNNQPSGKIAEAISQAFGSVDEFKKQFQAAALSRFGSGWAWLVKNNDGKLIIGSTPNQDNPLMDVSELKGTPLLGIDVWEHAYYLKYQNKRNDYITAWWNLVNWDEVAASL
jgi:Fe-Mn family superoxide dismutase